MRIVGVILALLLGAYIIVNAAYMLVSPRAWYRLPRWLRANGSLSESKYSTGPEALTIRMTGLLLLGTIAWVLYDSFVR
jgi:hypothetical protein